MPKIIIVTGVANRGKTTAIKQAMNQCGVYVGSGGNDILVGAQLTLQGQACNVGFASGGDTLAVVQGNINFFSTLPLTHMVFACRSSGAGYNALQGFAASLGVKPIMLNAPNPQLVQNILSHLP